MAAAGLTEGHIGNARAAIINASPTRSTQAAVTFAASVTCSGLTVDAALRYAGVHGDETRGVAD